MKQLRTLVIAMTLAALSVALIVGCNKAQSSEPTQTNATPQSDEGTEQSTVAKESNGVQVATIVIDGGNYSPASISVKKGVPVELTFMAGDNPGCGTTLVFSSLDITKEVDSKPVVVKFMPKEAGTIAFTCGMGMYNGEVVVK